MSFPSEDLPLDSDEANKEHGTLGKIGLFFLEIIKVAVLAGITIGLVRYFLFKPFYVKGQSMEPNYEEKQYLIVDELSYRLRAPERGEVVVLKSPITTDEFYLKRVIGLPGERIVIKDNKVIIYNDAHPEGIVLEEKYLTQTTSGDVSFTLDPDQYFVMGDNRGASLDSRRFGPIERSAIIGRTWLRGWPFNAITKFDKPGYNL